MRRLLWLTLAALTASALPASAQTDDATPSIEPRDCGVADAPVELDCYTLAVPQRRDASTDDTFELAVMVLHSYASEPEPDPVVFLQGGPGGSGIEGFENFYTSPMLDTRDIILFDQRGTGISGPDMDCPERDDATHVDFSRAEPYSVELEALRDATRECRERLTDAGVDLDAFDTHENAADVADLRVALEIDEWNLYGVSYGTRLALETMRSFPDGIRSAVLDSVYAPNVNGVQPYVGGVEDAFARLQAACDADTSCAELQPDLLGILQTAVERFDADPVPVTLADGRQLSVTGSDVLAGLWNAQYVTDNIPTLPTIIESLATGDASIIPVLAEEAASSLDLGNDGMFLSVECADNGPMRPTDESLIEDPGREEVIVRYAAQPYCDIWDVDPLPKSFRKPVRSKIPTLVLAGSLDPVTASADSERAAKRLARSLFVEFTNFGHAVTVGTDCPRRIRQQFLTDPEASVAGDIDTSCADEPPPGFLSQGLI